MLLQKVKLCSSKFQLQHHETHVVLCRALGKLQPAHACPRRALCAASAAAAFTAARAAAAALSRL